MENDLKLIKKNVVYIRQCLTEIENMNKESLVENTKEVGNNIITIYDNMTNSINEQRSENLRLQFEIINLNKEKNSLRHEIKKLAQQTKKLEEHLGVDSDPKFDNLVFEA